MRADYNSIFDTYRAFESDINEISKGVHWTEALEAEATAGSSSSTQTSTSATAQPNPSVATPSSQAQTLQHKAENVTDASKAAQNTARDDQKKAEEKKDPTKFQQVMQKIREFLQKIMAIIESLKRKIGNRLRMVLQTDKGFKVLLNKRKAMIKPLDSVRVISYQYQNGKLEEPMKRLMNEVNQCLNTLAMPDGSTNMNGRISEILQAPQGQMLEVLFSPYVHQGGNASGPIKSTPEFVKFLVESYRGEKQEFVYRASQISDIERNAMMTTEINTRCNAYIKAAEGAYNRIKTLEYQIRRNTDSEKVITMIQENARKASVLYNAYNALVSAYFEARLEQSLNYRVILKKFYQM